MTTTTSTERNGLGKEGPTVEFVDGMEDIDQAIRSMSAMLNRYNRADIYIGVNIDGIPTGADVSEKDADVIRRRVGELMNRLPQTMSVDIVGEEVRYIHISATGYETPYAYGSWFYTRKCNPTQPNGPKGGVVEEWTETLTCGMKRHRGDWMQITIHGDSTDSPLVVMNSYGGDGRDVYDTVRSMTGSDFQLLNVSGLDWNHDMAPWDSPAVFKGESPFTGGADEHLKHLLDAVSEHAGPDREVIIAGYSMAGLFSIYSLYRTDRFSKAVSASGSLWFPGMVEFMESNRPVRIPEKVYLSLGDRESRTRNPVMATVGDRTAKAESIFREMGSEVLFESNPGNHFQDAVKRISKGIAWALQRSGPSEVVLVQAYP